MGNASMSVMKILSFVFFVMPRCRICVLVSVINITSRFKLFFYLFA